MSAQLGTHLVEHVLEPRVEVEGKRSRRAGPGDAKVSDRVRAGFRLRVLQLDHRVVGGGVVHDAQGHCFPFMASSRCITSKSRSGTGFVGRSDAEQAWHVRHRNALQALIASWLAQESLRCHASSSLPMCPKFWCRREKLLGLQRALGVESDAKVLWRRNLSRRCDSPPAFSQDSSPGYCEERACLSGLACLFQEEDPLPACVNRIYVRDRLYVVLTGSMLSPALCCLCRALVISVSDHALLYSPYLGLAGPSLVIFFHAWVMLQVYEMFC